MNFREHEDTRQWIISALQKLGQFVRYDADFRGNKPYQLKAIGYQRQFMEDGKYRVVFLGTFNVGKSTAINAFLGGGYLPMDVEECTSKLTFIQRGERLQLIITLSAAVSANEQDALGRPLADIPASVSTMSGGNELRITYGSNNPSAMCRSLEPFVTVMADEEYPHLAPLRDKIEELNLYLPSTVLEEDIVIVDTPGVHSVSETRQEITYGIIEHSHLVISFVDSSFAGNIHDLNFIKRIINWRGRRVFFVLNKADKLESDEIDVRLGRGPAKSLLEAFHRHDIPEDSEVFFLSGYRALRAQQIDQGHTTLEDVLEDNRLSIPTSVVERIQHSDSAERDLSAYLMGQSRLPHLKERLLDYLLNENKAGTVVETAARFVWERADDFVIPFANEMKLAKDPSKFDELKANRDQLLGRLEAIRQKAEQVLVRYDTKCSGGRIDTEAFRGYATQFRQAMSEDAIQDAVIAPLLEWLREGNHLKEARRSKFKTLSAQMEHQVDEFVSANLAQLTKVIEANENETREAIARHLGEVRSLRVSMAEPGHAAISELDASMTGSYAAFGAGGAAIGAAAGAAVGTVVPIVGTAIGAGLGGLLGAVTGFLARLAWSEDRWLKKLEPVIRENAMNMLIVGGKNSEGKTLRPILDSVTGYLKKRANAFREAVHDEVENAVNTVQKEIDGLIAREDEIRSERDAILNRLQPKVDMLNELRQKAETIQSPAQSSG